MRNKNFGNKYLQFGIPSKLTSFVLVGKKDTGEKSPHSKSSLANGLQKVRDEGGGCNMDILD